MASFWVRDSVHPPFLVSVGRTKLAAEVRESSHIRRRAIFKLDSARSRTSLARIRDCILFGNATFFPDARNFVYVAFKSSRVLGNESR